MLRNREIKIRRYEFCPGCSTTDQILTMKQIFEKSWEYSKDVFACFSDHEKEYDQILQHKLWRVLQEYGFDDGHKATLLSA